MHPIHAWAKWKVGAGLALLVATALAACGQGNPAENGTGGTIESGTGDLCAKPATGCSCDVQGQTTPCGSVKETFGNYVMCTEGSMTCTDNAWGPCVADHTTFQSTESLGGGGVSLQGLAQSPDASSGTCANNPCDPTCQNFTDNPSGVDGGAGLALTDAGGWTLSGNVTEGGTCTGFQCNIPSCGSGTQATLTGTVYDPAGLNYIYQAQVYVPATLPLPAIPSGAQMDSCGGGGNLPPSVAYAVTGPNGQFTIGPVPVSASMTFPLVVQVGKWRRQFTYSLSGCQANPVSVGNLGTSGPGLLLPSTTAQGNIPHIAIGTGMCDAMECLMTRIGVASSQFGNPGGGQAIDMYDGNGTSWNTSVQTMLGQNLQPYDLVMLPCECGDEYSDLTWDSGGWYWYTQANVNNIATYANAGGRVFTSHWGREWIEGGGWTAPFPSVANWVSWPTANNIGSEPNNYLTGQILTGTQVQNDFDTWMQDVGGANASGQFGISPWRVDLNSLGASSQGWVDYTGGSYNGKPTDMTFNTPYGASTTYGRVMYTDMHLSYFSSQCGDETNPGYDYYNNGWRSCGSFPSVCTTGALSAQEKAAEFLLFNLQGCTTPLPPPPPNATLFYPSTFTRDYQGVCPSGSRVVWHLFSWGDSTPSNSSGNTNITFTAFTADTEAQLGTQFTTAASLATASGAATGCYVPDAGSPVCPDVDTALIASGVPTWGQPAYASHSWLRVNITLNPTPDNKLSPVLNTWNQSYDCVAAE